MSKRRHKSRRDNTTENRRRQMQQQRQTQQQAQQPQYNGPFGINPAQLLSMFGNIDMNQINNMLQNINRDGIDFNNFNLGMLQNLMGNNGGRTDNTNGFNNCCLLLMSICERALFSKIFIIICSRASDIFLSFNFSSIKSNILFFDRSKNPFIVSLGTLSSS